MDDLETILEQHTAGPQLIGFDYQFYYFMYLTLELKHGEQIGFEVKDDIHIDKADGTTILFQAKHTTLKNSDGTPHNLTTLDLDLWKTLSNWSIFINSSTDPFNFLSQHSFCLETNKSENNNELLASFSQFKSDKDIDNVLLTLKKLESRTTDKTIKSYIKNVISLKKRKLREFILKLTIETNNDDIIGKIRNRIFENVRQADMVDPVFESLSSNLNLTKYIEIKKGNKVIITFDDFNKKFGRCFRVAFQPKPLPKRRFTVNLPNDLGDQTFVKQLLDIGEINKDSPKIIDYSTQMLQALNQFSYWSDKNFVLPTEIDEFERNSILFWNNEFRAKYRNIEKQVNAGTPIEDLEVEIQFLGTELVDSLRRKDLQLQNDILGIELSNGHFYVLSDKPEIGWHYTWEDKYK